jgi:hypothetical protein
VLVGATVAGVLILRGGDDSRAVLHEGIRMGFRQDVRRYSDDEARKASRSTETTWRRELERRARDAPRQRFANPTPETLRARLSAAARRYGFDVVAVDLLRPRQLAPRIVVRTDDYLQMAQSMADILRTLDPKARTGDDRTGWRYEGFYFEADDGDGVPFALAFNFWRGSSGGGGQWARSERLYPFVHL